jgi:hypothetical protein
MDLGYSTTVAFGMTQHTPVPGVTPTRPRLPGRTAPPARDGRSFA